MFQDYRYILGICLGFQKVEIWNLKVPKPGQVKKCVCVFVCVYLSICVFEYLCVCACLYFDEKILKSFVILLLHFLLLSSSSSSFLSHAVWCCSQPLTGARWTGWHWPAVC